MKILKNIVQKSKALAVAGAVALTGAVYGADGAANSLESGTAVDISAVNTEMANIGATIKSFITSNLPIIGAIMGLAVLVVLLFVGFKLFKRATNKA